MTKGEAMNMPFYNLKILKGMFLFSEIKTSFRQIDVRIYIIMIFILLMNFCASAQGKTIFKAKGETVNWEADTTTVCQRFLKRCIRDNREAFVKIDSLEMVIRYLKMEIDIKDSIPVHIRREWKDDK